MAAFPDKLLLKPERGCMMSISRVPQGEEPGGIDENLNCRHKRCDRYRCVSFSL
jgi:hypothetical protein